MYFHWQACGILMKDLHGSTDKFNINIYHMAKEKLRLDVMLKEKGLVSSRAKGQALIMAGSVQVDGVTVTKSGFPVSNAHRNSSIRQNVPEQYDFRPSRKYIPLHSTFVRKQLYPESGFGDCPEFRLRN